MDGGYFSTICNRGVSRGATTRMGLQIGGARAEHAPQESAAGPCPGIPQNRQTVSCRPPTHHDRNHRGTRTPRTGRIRGPRSAGTRSQTSRSSRPAIVLLSPLSQAGRPARSALLTPRLTTSPSFSGPNTRGQVCSSHRVIESTARLIHRPSCCLAAGELRLSIAGANGVSGRVPAVFSADRSWADGLASIRFFAGRRGRQPRLITSALLDRYQPPLWKLCLPVNRHVMFRSCPECYEPCRPPRRVSYRKAALSQLARS